MINPRYMCDQHLLGEHVELHMLVGHLKRKRSITGYVKNNCVEVTYIEERHEELVREMIRRGMNHQSPIEKPILYYLNNDDCHATVDITKNRKLLHNRCPNCRRRMTGGPNGTKTSSKKK